MTFLGLLLTIILGLPLLGIILAGNIFPAHLTIFPIPTEPGHASFSWPVCGLLAVLITGTLIPFIWRFFQIPKTYRSETRGRFGFPWWGWLAISWVIGSWLLAWTRFSWFEAWQPHTFSLLWLGSIATLNALTYQRSGQCSLTRRPRFLGKLFFLSAGFWWAFEYLNQYVNNWHYVNLPETSPYEYIVFTSLSFSTVLPAVFSTYEWLGTFPGLTKPFESWQTLHWVNDKNTGWGLLISGSLALSLIGIWPTLLFPLLWLAPLGLLLGLQILQNKYTIISSLEKGNWRPVILSALAASFCGIWWELWNTYSLVHWKYTIPYVHAFTIFEMPILGYSGYWPFGLTCLAITQLALAYPPLHQEP